MSTTSIEHAASEARGFLPAGYWLHKWSLRRVPPDGSLLPNDHGQSFFKAGLQERRRYRDARRAVAATI